MEFTPLDFTAFRSNLRRLIDSRGAMNKDIALECGITPATMSRYLSGQRAPELMYVVRLAECFNVSIDWLLGFSDNAISLLPDEVSNIVELYSLANDDDRRVIHAVLNKYKKES